MHKQQLMYSECTAIVAPTVCWSRVFDVHQELSCIDYRKCGHLPVYTVRVQPNPTLLHWLTEAWVSSRQIGETHVEGGLHLGTKQRQSTSFSHLQSQIVDVHLQSGVSG